MLDLRRIPNCNSLVIGHNGLGGFGLWDISKRVLLFTFDSPGSRIFQIIPVSLFNWEMPEEHIKDSMQVANSNNLASVSKDTAIWLLVFAAAESVHDINDFDGSNAGLWRLALLVNNRIIMGNILDPRAIAVDTSAGSGIIGTIDGSLYKWELPSGKKLANLPSMQCVQFKTQHTYEIRTEGGVSCVAVDAKSGAVAAAASDGSLQIFIEPRKNALGS